MSMLVDKHACTWIEHLVPTVGMLFVYLGCTELYKLFRRRLTRNDYQGGPKMMEKNLPRFDTQAVDGFI